MTDTTFWMSLQSGSGTTKEGETNTFNVNSNCTGCWVAGTAGQNDPFNVDGTLIFNLAAGASVSLGGWGDASYRGAIIGQGGVVEVNGSGQQGTVNSGNTWDTNGYFNIAGKTYNNGTIDINNCTLYNWSGDWHGTSSITGFGTINLTNVTLAKDQYGNQDCYWYSSFVNVQTQTINLQNSQISFGTKNGDGSIDGVSINCSGGNNYIAFNVGMQDNVKGLSIRGFGGGDIIDFGSRGYSDTATYDPQTGILTLATYNAPGSLVYLHIDIGLGYDPTQFHQVKTYTGSNDYGIQYDGPAPCYLAGTLIETDTGMKPVEILRPGDIVLAIEGDRRIGRRVLWAGKTRIERDEPADRRALATAPVVIRRNALAPEVPFRDLHVTAEHCLFLSGGFVPARMLVNGISISHDTERGSYDVYHIELEKHSVINANGALSESFLDTGHVRLGKAGSKVQEWGRDSCHPLRTDRDFVEPLHRRLMSLAGGREERAVQRAPQEIALLVNGARRVAPLRRSGNTVVFSLEGPVHTLSLLATTVVPGESIGPYVDDRRELGVLVGEIHLFSPTRTVSYTRHLEGGALQGWHDHENTTCRWTGGRAELPGLHSDGECCLVSLVIMDGAVPDTLAA